MWAKADVPLEPRVTHGFLFGLKHLLVDWSFVKGALWVDEGSGTLSLGTEMVVNAAVSGGKLVPSFGPGWQEYFAAAVAPLQASADEKLARAQTGTKGKGKVSADRGKGSTKGKATDPWQRQRDPWGGYGPTVQATSSGSSWQSWTTPGRWTGGSR